MSLSFDATAEWLEADGLGGFASGTASGIRTRRYHALLLVATTPPTGRFVLVNGIDAWIETPAGSFAISSQRYAPDVIHPDGSRRIEQFDYEPWPHWQFRLDDDTTIEQELFALHEQLAVALRWKLARGATPAAGAAILNVRLLLSGRDYHSLHHENTAFRFDAAIEPGYVAWRPYDGVPGTTAITNGDYRHDPLWFRNFLYAEELARGLDATEDLASPGVFRWDLARGDAVLVLTTDAQQPAGREPARIFKQLRTAEEKRRRTFATPLDRAADAYIVRRGTSKTIIAGYPWFADWGRDTFIALRGLCLATGRLDDAREILLDWAGTVSSGMLPNRFPDHDGEPEFNSVDASLWYVIAVHDFLAAMKTKRRRVAIDVRSKLEAAVQAILAGYAAGTRFGIRMDSDGLVAAGVPGVQLTWMDAKVGDWVVTPRIGKPVEVQCLWLNALWIGSQLRGEDAARWADAFERGRAAFHSRFWNDSAGCLFDVVDVNHEPGRVDPAFRPNQIFAVGGLPLVLVDDDDRARRVVDAVESRLWTPLGLRSLASGESGHRSRYEGGVVDRDGAYHQGTVWPWLIGPFVEAWLRVRGNTTKAKQTARSRFLEPLISHLDQAGLGHVSEIADAEPPHAPRGCPFQAWSLGELLRVDRLVSSK